MRILFTGGSSFTGYWFIKELVAVGHDVTCTFTRSPSEYTGLRGNRVAAVQEMCSCVFDCTFGSDVFCSLLTDDGRWDLLAHHGADVTNYKSRNFDIYKAVHNNTYNLPNVLSSFAQEGGKAVLLTGTYFEQDEGRGSAPLEAFSPYGLSKGLTYQVFRYWCAQHGLPLGKFVIPNPFGPYEEMRFTSYLARTWLQGDTPVVNTPDYVRDNIHVSLLALGYAHASQKMMGAQEPTRLFDPSGYAESNGEFARRCARELEPRLGVPCNVELADQMEFTEPVERTNGTSCDPCDGSWDERIAWDELAVFYRQQFGSIGKWAST